MVDFPLVVAPCRGGWCIAMEKESEIELLTFAWETKEEAEQFLRITRPDLDFIPSKLP